MRDVTWDDIKIPTKLLINKNDVTSEIGIGNEFNKFSTNIGPDLAGKIPTASRTFESSLNKIGTKMPADPITINELKEAFFSIKINKSAAYQEVSSKYYQKLLQWIELSL